MEPILIPVELIGGPLDGHRDLVGMPEIDVLDVHLFQQSRPGETLRCAYGWAGRSTAGGRRWVLEFRCVVSRWHVIESEVLT